MRGERSVAPVDARIRLIAAVGYVVVVVLTPPGVWMALVGEGLALAFVVGWAGVDPAALLRRWLGFVPLVAFLALMIAPGHPARGELGLGGVLLAILGKNSLAFVGLATLMAVTTVPVLLGALGRLGVPPIFLTTLRFMERQGQILRDELARMVQARRARSFRRGGRLDLRSLSGLVGMLLLRSFERGERVHSAMLARGWDGVGRSLDGADP